MSPLIANSSLQQLSTVTSVLANLGLVWVVNVCSAFPLEGWGTSKLEQGTEYLTILRRKSSNCEPVQTVHLMQGAVQDLVRPFVQDDSQKKERRKLDKFITLNVQQISGTQQQVSLLRDSLPFSLSQYKKNQTCRTQPVHVMCALVMHKVGTFYTRLHFWVFGSWPESPAASGS